MNSWIRSGTVALGLVASAATFAALARRRDTIHHTQDREAWDRSPLRILILGGGFGGVAAAKALDRALPPISGASVLLVDRGNAQLFVPLLWPVAAGRSSAEDIMVPLRAFQRGRHFHVLHAEISAIDLERRIVTTSAGDYRYDRLIVALGSVTAIPASVAGARDHARVFRTITDAVGLRNRIIDALERAHQSDDPDERAAWLRFVVIGGGDTGTELAATIADFVRYALGREYPWLVEDPAQVVIVEALDRLVPLGSELVSRRVRRSLEGAGIEVRLGTGVERIDEHGVVTADGTIAARTVFWSAGNAPPPLVRALPLEHAENGAVLVDDRLRALGRPDVFVVGDSCWIADGGDGRPVPALAQAAEREADHVARTIAAELAGRPTRPFRFRKLGQMTLLGRFDAIAELGPLVVAGPVAWFAWHGYYALKVGTWRTRAHLVIGWFATAVFGPGISEIPLEDAKTERA